jgi:hypothetical protein
MTLKFIHPITILLLGLSAGCTELPSGWGNLQIWAVPETKSLSRDASPVPESAVFSQAANTVHLEGAVNEVVACQLVFKGEDGPATVTDISIEAPQGANFQIPPENLKLYKVGWVPVSEFPTWYLRLTPHSGKAREFIDPLIPLDVSQGGLPMEITSGKCSVVWVEMRIPSGTPAGSYQGNIRINVQQGFARELKLQLRVFPFALPQTRHLTVVTGFGAKDLLRHHLEVNGEPYVPGRISFEDPAYGRVTNCLDATARLLHEHRCEPVIWGIEPHRHYGPEGQLQLDWSDYDRLVGGLLDGSVFENRIGVDHWPIPLRQGSPPPQTFGGWGSGQFAKFLKNYLRLCAHHFETQGWLERQFIWCPPPGNSWEKQYDNFRWMGKQVDAASQQTRLLCPLTPNSLVPYGARDDGWEDVSPWVHTWCPPASLADFEALAAQRLDGKGTWLRPDHPPYAGSLSIVAPSTSPRSLGWAASRFEIQGILLPLVNDWAAVRASPAEGSRRALIWPGKPYGLERPIPSIRLKRLLRGLQDYEYLWLLKQNARPGIAERLAKDLVPFGGASCYMNHFLDSHPYGLVLDEAPWRLARRIMARELEKLLGQGEEPAVPDDFGRFEEKIDWSWFSQQVRRVHLMVEGISTAIEPADQEQPVHLKATIWLLNATRDAVSGRLVCTNLPDGWAMAKPFAEIDRLAPLQGIRKTVHMKAPPFSPGRLGNRSLEFALFSNDPSQKSEPVATDNGRLAVLVSQRTAKTPVIDGKLDDWAAGTTNVAGDFILIGAQDVPKDKANRPARMEKSTKVYISNNDDYLYIAFNCKGNRNALTERTRSNYVRYDELWPRGEDLVEVVLDPTHQAVDSGDLYHLVVKSNGATITERGVPCLNPVAEHRPWPIDIQAAVAPGDQPGQWMVEIRLPLKDLGDPQRIWGINFARLDAGRGEYGSWSGARRYLYAPASLGSVRFAR